AAHPPGGRRGGPAVPRSPDGEMPQSERGGGETGGRSPRSDAGASHISVTPQVRVQLQPPGAGSASAAGAARAAGPASAPPQRRSPAQPGGLSSAQPSTSPRPSGVGVALSP
ncbi:unnamed protein product, partial [Prorocentrum cordatum]